MSFAYSPVLLGGSSGSSSSSSVGGGLITVGSSGIYPTINAAIEASHNVIFVNSATIETNDITIPSSGLYMTILPHGSVNMSNYVFSTDNAKLNINGNGTISYNYSSIKTLFDGNDNSRLNIDGIQINNNSSATSYITDINDAKFSNLDIAGNININGNRNIFSSCKLSNGNITINNGINNTILNSCVFDGILIIDSGNGTIISDGAVV